MDYLTNLQRLKKIAGGGSEAELIAAEIDQNAENGVVRVTDVGTADGRFFSKVIRNTTTAECIDLVAIEPREKMARLASANLTDVRVINKSLTDAVNDIGVKQADVCLSAHSIYYFGGLNKALQDLRDLTISRGTVIISVWSRYCDLYETAVGFYPKNRAVTGEQIVSTAMKPGSRLKLNWAKSFEGPIEVDELKSLSDREKLDFLTFLCRMEKRPSKDKRKDMVDIDGLFEKAKTRRNFVISLQKRS